MRPISLEMKNFGSYKSEVLSFNEFDIAVISGESGSGKSTIPDAIIWALYGRSERESVLSHAADEKKDAVEVTLRFELDGQEYEVNRRRGSKSDLSLYTVNENGEKVNISEKGIRGVDAQIQKLLGMDYETFRLTAFVPQDGVNTFANLGPADRKHFLEQFLDTSVWDKCLEKAKAEESGILYKKAELDVKLKHDAALSEEESETSAAIENAKLELAKSDKELQKVTDEIQALTSRKMEDEFEGKTLRSIYDNYLAQQKAVESDISSIQSDIESLKASQECKEAPQRTIDEIRSDIDDVHAAEVQYLECVAKIKESERAEKQLSDRLRSAQDKIASSSAEYARLRSEADDIEEEIEASNAAVAQAQDAEKERDVCARKLSENDTSLHILCQELEELNKKENALSESKGKCPVCGSDLSDEHRQAMLSEVSAAKAENKTNTDAVLCERIDLNTKILELDKVIKTGKTKMQNLVALSSHLSRLNSAMDHVNNLFSEASSEIEREDYPHLINKEEMFQKEMKTVMSGLGNPELRMKQLREEEKFAAEYETFLKSQQERKEKLKQSEALLASKKKDAEQIKASLADAEKDLYVSREKYRSNNYQEKLEALSAEKNRVAINGNYMRGEIAKLESRMNEIRTAEENLPVLQGEISSLNQRLEDVRELIVAYGDKGIKALLIDQMLPSITKEANNVLSLLSDGRFTLDMNTLKSNKKGNDVETLDILLYKDGIRDRYENLSGGEKFKVNFALRIGLSKYLSEAADTRLDTLVIDEGFGSQDYTGRLNALRAIQAVSDRFGLILVITHFNDIKKVFDYEIETVKDVSGYSHATVVCHAVA